MSCWSSNCRFQFSFGIKGVGITRKWRKHPVLFYNLFFSFKQSMLWFFLEKDWLKNSLHTFIIFQTLHLETILTSTSWTFYMFLRAGFILRLHQFLKEIWDQNLTLIFMAYFVNFMEKSYCIKFCSILIRFREAVFIFT